MEREGERERAVQIDNLRGLLGIRIVDRVPNALIKELCILKKELDERIYEGRLRCFRSAETMERDRTAQRVYVGYCAGIRSVGRPRKRWINTVKESLKKRGLDVRQARRNVQDKNEWRQFVSGYSWGVARGMNP